MVHGLSVQDSCLMVFTVHGIYTALVLYVLPRAPPSEVHTALARYISLKTMRQLLHVYLLPYCVYVVRHYALKKLSIC